ncbi:MAG: DUF262 domain-containing protein [Epsilonproteobacteria bacterium]|nr:MAG: DUF262 domain-containing protein [Campylobacterota bacterium]
MAKIIQFIQTDTVNGIEYHKGYTLKVSMSIFDDKVNVKKTAIEVSELNNNDNVDIIEFEGEEGINAHKKTDFDDTIYPANIKFSTATPSVFEIKRQYDERQQIELAPSYQRGNVWTPKQKSELIESILMGIPLPLMYFFENSQGIYQVVDGKQRLTTLFSYLKNEFSLGGLNILKNVKGKKFKELKPEQQVKLEDFKLLINIIQYPTPDRVKFDIFDRVNRGGTRLNNQEMRNALYHGKATELLETLRNNKYFLKATNKSINSQVMKDRYIILRFISFYLWQKESLYDVLTDERIDYKSDIDDFLGKTMNMINHMNENEILNLKNIFDLSMKNSYEFLGKNAFRVSSYIESTRTRPINMALFETVAFLMTFDYPNNKRSNIKEELSNLLNNEDFYDAISSPVDSSVKVNKRFYLIKNMTEEIN